VSGISSEKLITAIAGGTMPDILTLMGKACYPLWRMDALLPMDDEVYVPLALDIESWFSPGAIGAYEWNGKYYGVPFEDNSVANFIAARLDWIQEAEAQDLWPPTQGKDRFDSVEEMWALAEALQREEGGVVTRWGLSREGWESIAIPIIMRGLGQDWWDFNEKKFYMDTEAGVEAIRQYAEIPTQELGIETEMNTSGFNAMMQSKAAVVQGTGSLPRRASEIGLSVEEVMAPPPIPNGENLYVGEGGWGLIVPAQAQNKEAAFELCRFACTYDTLMMWSRGGTTPSCKAVRADPFYQGDDPLRRSMRRVIQTLDYTKYIGTGFGSVGSFATVLPLVRNGEITAAEAAAQIQAALEDELSKLEA
jgi:ABC-type glycerol-3-phosphate transport system substrate-binding protein